MASISLTCVAQKGWEEAHLKFTRRIKDKWIPAFVGMTTLFFPLFALAGQQTFQDFVIGIRTEAVEKGISPATLDAALSNIEPDSQVIMLDRRQPEHKTSFSAYLRQTVTPSRIREGQKLLAANSRQLDRVSRTYGVPPQVIVALWGMETSYGKNTGSFCVPEALATLAWEGRRANLFRRELIDALKILDEGHISPSAMKGSWAGAMGQTQFMPSSFLRFAVDANGDGKRDIWNTKADVFASAANYLAQSGWKAGKKWGREVKIPSSFSDSGKMRPVSAWARLGIRRVDGGPLPSSDLPARLVHVDGRTFMVYENHGVLMHWNRSTYFATAVGLLADAIAGKGGV